MADDDVATRKNQNRIHADVTGLLFMDHDNFELLGPSPFGPGSKYALSDFVNARLLEADEFRPVATQELKLALGNSDELRAYFEAHRVRERWIYGIVVVDGRATLALEIRVEQGMLRYIDADTFVALRGDPEADEESDRDYLDRPEWKKPPLPALPDAVVVRSSEERWHFFGSALRLSDVGVRALCEDPRLLAPDPGLAFFGELEAGDASGPEQTHPLALGAATIARVFDPAVLVDNMTKELHDALDTFGRFACPDPQRDDVATSTRKRLLLVMIASRLESMRFQKHDTDIDEALEPSSQFMSRVLQDCYTADERRLLATLEGSIAVRRCSEAVLFVEEKLVELHLERVARCATKLLLFKSSHAWRVLHAEYAIETARTFDRKADFVTIVARSEARLGETDAGRRHMAAMCERVLDDPGATEPPELPFLERYILRDPEGPDATVQEVRDALKAGKLVFDAIKSYHALEAAMSRGHLELLAQRTKLPQAAKDAIEELTKEQRPFAIAAFRMRRRLQSLFSFEVVDVGVEKTDDAMLFFETRKGDGKPVKMSFRVSITTPGGLADTIEKIHAKFGVDRNAGFPLTFDHVASATGLIALAFNARDLVRAVGEEDDDQAAKSALLLVRGLYELPPVKSRLQRRIEHGSLFALSSEARKWIAKRGIPYVMFAFQVASTCFSVQSLWRKADGLGDDELWVSSLNLLSETAMTISAGLVLFAGSPLVAGAVATKATAVAAVVSLAGVGLAAGAYVLDQLRPKELEHLVSTSVFGRDFPIVTSQPNDDARVWQACPGNDLRHYVAGANGKQLGVDGLLTQLRGFENMMHNFHVSVRFDSDLVPLTGCVLRILPGAVPRQAYFEVELDFEWILDLASGQRVANTLRFRFYPFPANKTFPPDRRQPPILAGLHSSGISDVAGGPAEISVMALATALDLLVVPRPGRAASFAGVLRNIVGGKRVPARFPIELQAEYSVSIHGELDATGQNPRKVITITRLPGSDPDVAIDSVDLDLKYLVGGDTQGIHTEEVSVTNEAGSDEIRVEFPDEFEQGGASFLFLGEFALTPKYRDRGATGPSPIVAGQRVTTTGKHPDGPLDFTSSELFDFEIHFEATLRHDGRDAHVRFSATHAVLDPTAGTSAIRIVKEPKLDLVVFQFVRNEGAGAPLQAGSRSAPLFEALGGIGTSVHEKVITGRIHLFDELQARFTAEIRVPDGRAFTEGPFEAVDVPWSYPPSVNHEDIERLQVLSIVESRIRLVLDGDEAAELADGGEIELASSHLPSTLVKGAKQPFAVVRHERNPFSDESTEIAAIDACET